jgi:hypothetical protein
MSGNEEAGAARTAEDLMMEIVIKTDSSADATLTRGSDSEDGKLESEKLKELSRESGTSSKTSER